MLTIAFIARVLGYMAACIGAGWFGLWVYSFGWTRPLEIVAIAGGVTGIAIAVAVTLVQRSRDRNW
jgi:hypothetical protein